MTTPAYMFVLLIGLLYGAVFHLLRDGNGWRLLLYLLLGILGFLIGLWIGDWRGWILLPMGPVNFGLGTIGSILFLICGDWLSRIETGQESKV